MATDQQFKMGYAQSQTGHQMYDMCSHSMARNPCHRPNLTHSTTSAFRPTGMPPQVPLQKRLVSPIPSSHGQYQQQRPMPCVDNGKHAMQQLDLQQRLHHQQEHQQKLFLQQEQQQKLFNQHEQQQQERQMFQKMSRANPVNTYPDIAMDIRQRSASTSMVQPAAPGRYPAVQQYSNDQAARERESLHQELRLLHAVHYQDMNRKDEILETYWHNKQLGGAKKHGLISVDSHHSVFERQRKAQVLQDPTAVLRQKLAGESHTCGQKIQQVFMPSPQELYQANNRMSLSSSMSTAHPQMAYAEAQAHRHSQAQAQRHSQAQPRQHMQFESSVHHRVPDQHILPGTQERVNKFVASSESCFNYQRRDGSYEAQQQYQARLAGREVLIQQLPVRQPHQEVHHCKRNQTYYPSQPFNSMHPLMQQQLQKHQLQYQKDPVPAETQEGTGSSQTQEQLQKQMQQLRKERVFNEQGACMKTLRNELTKNKTSEEEDKQKLVETDSKESMRLSQMTVSIKEEQMQLKEVLEKSLHRAAFQGMKKEVKEDVSDDSKHVIPNSVSDMESMPRIVEVRSLAEHEFSGAIAVPHSGSSKAHGNSAGDMLGMRHSKPKSLMIKAHQEFQEVPTNANRVPSIGSMDSDNGRKDSRDSGIESPPWPENREASLANIKRPASFPCEDTPFLEHPHKSQKMKMFERKQSENSLVTTGLDLFATDQTNLPAERILNRKEQSMTKTDDVVCSSFQEAFVRSQHFSLDDRETRTSERTLASVNRKRSWPCNDLCPVDAKVVSKEQKTFENSSLRQEMHLGKNAQSKESISPKSQQVKSITIGHESPLDLSCKKEKDATSNMPSEKKEIKLEENEIRIEEKANVDEFKEESKETESKIKKDKAYYGDDKKEIIANAGGNATPSTENQMQVYFGDIMMRALKRLWSESKLNLDGDGTSNPKPEFVESSDEDSGKYFQPSSVTTLKHIPQVESPDGSHLPQENDREKKRVPSSCSDHSLEAALCELMHHSSDAFKHGGDIFQHFDKILKRELMVEIQKQPLKCNNEPKVTDTMKEADTFATQSDISPGKLTLDKLCEQTSEAVAVCDTPTNVSCEDEEIDETQDLVIVESSISPKPSPDSQVNETQLEQNYQIASVVTSSGPVRTSVTFPADSSVNRISSQLSPNSARTEAQETAHQAAQEAARLAAARAATSATARLCSTQASVKVNSSAGVSNVQNTSVKPRLSNMPSSVVLHGMKENRKMGKASPTFLAQYHQPGLQSLQYMGKSLPFTVESEECTPKTQSHSSLERRNSEPALLSHDSTDSTQKGMPHRMDSEDASQIVSLKNFPNAAPSVGTTFHILPQTIWPKQTQQQSDVNSVNLIKVTCNSTIQIQAPQTVTCIPNAPAVQKQMHKSPFVLLDKLVCVPGKTYPQAKPVVETQTCQKGKPVLLPKDTKQSTESSAAIQSVPAQPSSLVSPSQSPAPEKSLSPELIDYVSGPFRVIRKTPVEQQTGKKPFVNAFIIIYKNISLPGVLRSGVPFVPPRMVQDGMFPDDTFEEFCHALQDCNIMQRYMTVLERTALLNDLKRNKISSCKLVSLDEFHQKYDNIKVLMDMNKLT